jgi:hypothetical protein
LLDQRGMRRLAVNGTLGWAFSLWLLGAIPACSRHQERGDVHDAPDGGAHDVTGPSWTTSDACVGAQGAGTWRTMTATNDPALPAGMLGATAGGGPGELGAFWTGQRFVLLAGPLGTPGAAYDPCADSWSPLPAGGPRATSALAGIAGQGLLVIGLPLPGGMIGAGARLDAGARTWTSLNMLGAPSGPVSKVIFTQKGAVLFRPATTPPGFEPLDDYADGHAYDMDADQWRTLTGPAGLIPRRDHVHVMVGGRLVVWGGTAERGDALGDGAAYDLLANRWRSVNVAGAPSARSRATAVSTGSELIVWSGAGNGGAAWLSDGAIYDPLNDRWRPMSTMNAPRLAAVLSSVWTGRKLVVLGEAVQPVATAAGGVYDPGADTWTALPLEGMPPVIPSRKLETHANSSGQVLLFVESATALPTVATLDLATARWTPASRAGAPTRSILAQLWTGERFIAWGGVEPIAMSGPCPQGVTTGCDTPMQFRYFPGGAIYRAP